MLKTILSTATILILLGAFSTAGAQSRQNTANGPKGEPKFLDDITIEMAATTTVAAPVSHAPAVQPAAMRSTVAPVMAIEEAVALQFKYALLLDTEVESLTNLAALETMEEWFGTRYRLGGTTKAGIDCSALMQIFFSAVYSISLPRTAREQHAVAQKIDRETLEEGDLVFFNTTGGISHVGVYLRNNKFYHASSSGVMVSDLEEDYWRRHFISAGRVRPSTQLLTSRP